jgi:iron-sulfur cluster assembly protein
MSTTNTTSNSGALRRPPPPIRISDAAAQRINDIVAKSTKPVLGIRVSVAAKGCSGNSYVVEYAEEQRKFEDVVEHNGAKVFVDRKAVSCSRTRTKKAAAAAAKASRFRKAA